MLPFAESTVLPFAESTVLPFTESTVLPFAESTVLPFAESTVLPFAESTVLPFPESTVLPAISLLEVDAEIRTLSSRVAAETGVAESVAVVMLRLVSTNPYPLDPSSR